MPNFFGLCFSRKNKKWYVLNIILLLNSINIDICDEFKYILIKYIIILLILLIIHEKIDVLLLPCGIWVYDTG